MPVLKNARHEKFAQGLAKGKTAEKAYVDAGFKANRHNAAALARSQHISTRLKELQTKAAEKAGVTIQSLTDELDAIKKAAAGAGQHSAALGAVMGKAKLHGLLIEKKQHSGPNGGAIPIDLTNVSDEQLAALKAIFGPLAGGTGDDDEGDPSGGSEA
jgi:hypothetical protein